MDTHTSRKFHAPSFAEACIILLVMLVILGLGVIKFGMAPKVPVLLVITLLALWAKARHASFDQITSGIAKGINAAVVPLVIFLLIGALIAVWIQASIIPTLMAVGFDIIAPQFFLPSSFLVCALIGVSIGSGFTTISTVGIALLGIGITMGQSPAVLAGAILSGAIFGDKMSPLSDSTNLASAVAGSELFAHIKNMMWSTIPAFIGSLIGFAWLNHSSSHSDLSAITQTKQVISANFNVDWWAIIPILLLFVCAWKKIPAIFTLLINLLVSCAIIFIHNRHFSLAKLATVIESGYVAKTSSSTVNTLLTRGGINSMADTITLILLTLSLGGLLMEFDVIQNAITPLAKRLTSPGSLITTTIFAGIFVNVFVGEQYLSVILPGQAFKPSFARLKLAPLALSRTLEDGGSVINYLIPWGVAGSFAASALHVSVIAFLPFVFFSLLSPVFSILSGVTHIGLKRLKD